MKANLKVLSLLLAIAMLFGMLCACAAPAEKPAEGVASEPAAEATAPEADAEEPAKEEINWPTDTVTMWVPYNAGGGKDMTARALQPLLEKELGSSVIVDNKAGSSGAVGAQYVRSCKADGYNLLFSGEALETYQVMGLIDDYNAYDAWTPIGVFSTEIPSILVNAKSKFAQMDWPELLQYILDHPSEVTWAGTGVGSVQWNWMKLLQSVYGVELLDIAYEGGNASVAALVGGHVDLLASGPSSTLSYIESGEMIPIVTLNTERLEAVGAPCISEYTKEFDPYLPYGSYSCLFAPAGVDEAVIEKLTAAAEAAFNEAEFQSFVTETQGISLVGLFGEDALDFVKTKQATTTYILYDAGECAVDPATFGIERVG